MARYQEIMTKKLNAAFSPEHLLVRDDSDQHAGHAGAHPDGETHFYVEIRADAFNGKSRVERQRMVMHALKDELDAHVHALALKVEGTA